MQVRCSDKRVENVECIEIQPSLLPYDGYPVPVLPGTNGSRVNMFRNRRQVSHKSGLHLEKYRSTLDKPTASLSAAI